jgi:hypothetical protein
MQTIKVGIREFRSGLAEFIASNSAVAITRHGQTVGYFIPTNGQTESDMTALINGSKALNKIIAAKKLILNL